VDSKNRDRIKNRINRFARDRIDRGLIRRFEPPVTKLLEEFSYRVQPTMLHHELLRQMEIYFKENELFMASVSRSHQIAARKALNQIWHLCRLRRKEIKSQYLNRERSRFGRVDVPDDLAHRQDFDKKK
jgi:hypothetical protein